MTGPGRKAAAGAPGRTQGHGRQQIRLPMGRSVPFRRPALRGGDADHGDGARLRPGQAAAARDRGLRQGEERSGDLRRDGRARPARRDDSGGVRRRRRLLCRLWPHRPRSRAGRQRLSLDDERAVVAGHAPDPRLRDGGAEAQIPAEAGARRSDRLLRPDRGRRRLRPRRDADAGREDRRRLSPQGREDVDLQRADRRRLRRLGEVGRARRRDQGLRAGQGPQGPDGAEDRGQAVAAHVGHRRDRARRCRGRRGRAAARRRRTEGPVRLPQPRPLRHRLGRDGRGGGLP